MKKFLGRETVFYFLFSLGIILLAQIPVFLHILHTPKGFYYPLLDQVSQSDFYYIALVRSGMGENFLTKIPYVSSDHPASLIQIPFILMGKLSLISGIGPAEMTALFRIFGGIILLISAILFIKIILPKNLQKITFLLFLLTEPLPTLKHSLFKEWYSQWVWHFGDAARRISSVPSHYSLGKGFALLSLYFLFAYIKSGKKKLLLTALVIAVLSGLIYPPPVFIIAFSLGSASFFYFLINARKIKIIQIKVFGSYIIACLIPLIILKTELSKGYPWNMWNRVELGWNDPSMQFEIHYFRMFWWLFLLVPFFLPKVIKSVKENVNYLFILIWSISAYIFFPFADLMLLGKFRFTEGVQIVPLSILGTLALSQLIQNSRVLRILFFLLFTGYFTVFSGLVFTESVTSLWPIWRNVYFTPELVEAFKFLDNSVPDHSVVLADYNSSNYLPAFALIRSPFGFSDFYPIFSEYKKDMETAENIIQYKKPESETLNFLKQKKIEYIFQDKSVFGDKELYPGFLEKIFVNSKTSIYKVELK